MDDETVKAEIFQFIKENSWKFYEVGLQVNFCKYPASYLRMILRQLKNEGKITNKGAFFVDSLEKVHFRNLNSLVSEFTRIGSVRCSSI